ncbi:MAG: 4Fe-4S binding protein [Planctomycetota bacterium]|nr:4Fe-4S binding protein [Planctomycetota bacterium]
MAHVISPACVSCGACKDECPVNAISEGSPYTIDSGTCVDCGACANVCPQSAIAPE